jgi:hypothetical protein
VREAEELFGAPLPAWRVYERVVAAIESENLGAGITCSATMNARMLGAISGIERQIDLLVEARWEDDRTRRIIVDAKHYGRPLNVKDVEAFEGMMHDCRAEHGILVCPNGWSLGTARRAKELITLKLLTLEDALERVDWAAFGECYGRCQEEPAIPKHGVVLWDGQLPLAIDQLWAIIWTGRCGRCHSFHVWCWDCGAKFALSLGESLESDCGRIWSLTRGEVSQHASEPGTEAIHLQLTVGDETMSIDRQSVT